MKKILIFICILTSFCFVKCEKDRTDVTGLPPATQEGKNTLGFLLNGEPWIPQGVRGTANLSIDYDPGYNQGIFSIVAYNFSIPISEQFIIGLKDSLNFMNAPIILNLSRESLYSISYNTPCGYFNQRSDVSSSGSLTITKLDKLNHIISGKFNATLSKNGCPTIQITEGRFDMRY